MITRLERRIIARAREPQIRAELDARRPRVVVMNSRRWARWAVGFVLACFVLVALTLR